MIKIAHVSSKEQKLFLIGCLVLLALGLDKGFQAWSAMDASLRMQKSSIEKQWSYSSAIIGRSASIEARFNDALARYPKLFESTHDTAKVMAELDDAAKASGIQMTMMRPVPHQAPDDKNLRYDLAFRGSWAQVMDFLKKAEGDARVFDFPILSMHRIEPTRDLEVTAVAVKQMI